MSNGSEHMNQGVTHHYHHEGLTDVSVIRRQAEKSQANGATAWVHQHSRLNECNDTCREYSPATKEN